MTFKRILVAVDAEPTAARAVNTAVDLARCLQGELALVHVIDPAPGYTPESGIAAEEMLSAAEDRSKQTLAMFRTRATIRVPPVELTPMGKPAAEIVKTANSWGADVIVIGSHGRAGMKRVLLGSVAEEVMRHAPCPVLIVRADD